MDFSSYGVGIDTILLGLILFFLVKHFSDAGERVERLLSTIEVRLRSLEGMDSKLGSIKWNTRDKDNPHANY